MYDHIELDVYALTDVGRKRQHNEDAFAIGNSSGSESTWLLHSESDQQIETTKLSIEVEHQNFVVFVVADGMGGESAGEVAATLCLKAIKGHFEGKVEPSNMNELARELRLAFESAQRAILSFLKESPKVNGMGTTVVAQIFHPIGVCIGWIGDSRLYRLNHRKEELELEMLTRDHSLVWQMVEKGDITPEEARTHELSHIITQNLGDPDHDPQIELNLINLEAGDRFLLCSDGLNGMISDKDIAKILYSEEDIGRCAETLRKTANDNGGVDNITLILSDVTRLNINEAHVLDTSRPRSVTAQQSLNPKKHWFGLFRNIFAGLILLIAIGFVFTTQLLPSLTNDSSRTDEQDVVDNLTRQNTNDYELSEKHPIAGGGSGTTNSSAESNENSVSSPPVEKDSDEVKNTKPQTKTLTRAKPKNVPTIRTSEVNSRKLNKDAEELEEVLTLNPPEEALERQEDLLEEFQGLVSEIKNEKNRIEIELNKIGELSDTNLMDTRSEMIQNLNAFDKIIEEIHQAVLINDDSDFLKVLKTPEKTQVIKMQLAARSEDLERTLEYYNNRLNQFMFKSEETPDSSDITKKIKNGK